MKINVKTCENCEQYYESFNGATGRCMYFDNYVVYTDYAEICVYYKNKVKTDTKSSILKTFLKFFKRNKGETK